MKQLSIIGNIGNIDMKYTPQGKAVTEFSVAVNSKVNGEKVTEWFKCTAWDKIGEIIHQFAGKGSRIYVSGSPKLEKWLGKDGSAGAQIVLTVREFEFLSPKNELEPAAPDVGDGENIY